MKRHLLHIMSVCLLIGGFVLTGNGAGWSANPLYDQVLEKLQRLQPGQTIDIEMGTAKDLYAIGDMFELRFQVSQPSYVILMHIAADDTITFLAPSQWVPDTRLQANKVYSTGVPFQPRSEYNWGLPIQVSPPGGTETLNLFCSPKKIELFPTALQNEPLYTIRPDDHDRLQDLLRRLEQFSQAEWAGKSVQITIPIPTPLSGQTRNFAPPRKGALSGIESTGTAEKFFPPIGTTGTTGKH